MTAGVEFDTDGKARVEFVPYEGPPPQPVEIVHRRVHEFVKPPKGGAGCRHVNLAGETCRKAKHNPLHYGAVPSLNVAGSGGNHFAYQNAKKALQVVLGELLDASGLPKGLDRIVVEGEMCFPRNARRDQGNFRYFIEKCLGDTLAAGGWLADDDWSRYSFGGLEYRVERGESWTRLMLFPTALASEGIASLYSPDMETSR